MQRSLVKEFKTTNSTLFQSTLLGTHSMLGVRQPLSPRSDPQQLASRIAHLPSDHRPDLGGDPRILLVFQAIQIQRLSGQVQFLRSHIRERQDVVINAGSYQVQIRELAQRCNKLQGEKYSYMQELGRTKQMSEVIFTELTALKSRYQEVDFSAGEKYKLQKARSEELSLEIEKWKGRYASLDRAKADDAEISRRNMELHRESVINSGTKEMLGRFQLEREELMGKLRERKEQLDEKELQLKKLGNCFEQQQVKLQEQEHSIEDYQQKVAMLSQQNYRLSEMLRIKAEEIKSLKMANEHDVSLKLSQITILDQTKHKINDKLRLTEQNNEDLRYALREAEKQGNQLKKRAAEADRLEYQVREIRKQTQTKIKMMERKDKRILILEEQVKNMKKTQEELAAFRRLSQQLASKIQALQTKIGQKIQQLRQVRMNYQKLYGQQQQQVNRLNDKLKQYERLYTSLEGSYKQIATSQNIFVQKSTNLELQARQSALQIKQKNYTISALQNQLKQIETRWQSVDQQHASVVRQLQQQILMERRNFQTKIRDTEGRRKEVDLLSRQKDSLARQLQIKSRQYEHRIKEYQQRNRQSDQRVRETQNHLRGLEQDHARKEQEASELRRLISSLVTFQDDLSLKQAEMSTELRSLQMRLTRIEQLLLGLRSNLLQRHKAALQNEQRLRITQNKYQDLHDWLFILAERMNQPLDMSPSPKKRISDSPMRIRNASPDGSYATSCSIYGYRAEGECRKQGQNMNHSNSGEGGVPVEWMMRFVLLCAQVEMLRKRVGDKQAKVQSLRNSIASKHSSSSTLLNALQSSSSTLNGLQTSSASNGFHTARESSLNRKGNIYY